MEHYSELRQLQSELHLSRKIFHIKGSVSDSLILSPPSSNRRRLWVDGIEILPEPAYGLRPFYECHFGWGNCGDTSSYTTGLAICLAIFKNERIAENLYGCFRDEFVQYLPDGNFETDIDLTNFLNKFKQRLHPDLYSCFCSAAMINSKEILLYKDAESGEIIANLADNYAIHNDAISNRNVRKLNERKQRLMFRMFAKEKYIIKGFTFHEVMAQVEELMSQFYWRSLERIIKKQFLDKCNFPDPDTWKKMI